MYEGNGQDAKSINYARLVAVLIEAVKEQHLVIENQNTELAEIKAKLDQLESALQDLRFLTLTQPNRDETSDGE